MAILLYNAEPYGFNGQFVAVVTVKGLTHRSAPFDTKQQALEYARAWVQTLNTCTGN